LGNTLGGVKYRGSQIVAPVDLAISAEITDAELTPSRSQTFEVVNESVIDDYISSVSTLVTSENSLKIVYTPLHGVGAEIFLKVFEKAKFTAPVLVAEQVKPDPDFQLRHFLIQKR
jgi:phosphomannomutase